MVREKDKISLNYNHPYKMICTIFYLTINCATICALVPTVPNVQIFIDIILSFYENISMSNLCLQTTCRQLLHKPDMRWCDKGTREPKPSRCRYVAVMYSFCLIEYMKVSCSRCKPLFLQQQYSMELSEKFILKSYMYISLLFYVINNTAYNNLLD